MDRVPLSDQFLLAFSGLILAAVLGVVGITILALPLGIIAGFIAIKEMIKKYFMI
jgi:hypothetical protein